MAQAARLQARQRYFNLVVTNVPGPQFPLYVLGRRDARDLPDGAARAEPRAGDRDHELRRPLAFGLNADFDALPDLELLAAQLAEALDELAVAAGLPPRQARRAHDDARSDRERARRRRDERRDLTLRRPRVASSRARVMESSSPPGPPHRRLRRLGIALPTLVVALGGFVLVLLFFEGRDDSQVPGSAGGGPAPGQVVTDQRRAQAPAPIGRDAVALSEDQLLHALELGDVVLLYGTRSPPPQLRALQDEVSGPFDPVLAANGAAVILAPRPGTDGVTALAWRRILRAPSASDPAIEDFADYWLGRGAGG